MKFSIAKIAALSMALALAGRASDAQADAAHDWTDKHFLAAFEEFFPIRQAQGNFIAVRAHQNGSNEAPEFSFVIENTEDQHAIRATLRQAQGASLYQQLWSLHAKDPTRAYADLKPELRVQTWNLDGAQCTAVLAQFNAFQHIQFVRPREEDEVEENPIVYEINETVAGGSSQVIEFIPTRAIPRWAVATRQALHACATSGQGNSSADTNRNVAGGPLAHAILFALSSSARFCRVGGRANGQPRPA